MYLNGLTNGLVSIAGFLTGLMISCFFISQKILLTNPNVIGTAAYDVLKNFGTFGLVCGSILGLASIVLFVALTCIKFDWAQRNNNVPFEVFGFDAIFYFFAFLIGTGLMGVMLASPFYLVLTVIGMIGYGITLISQMSAKEKR